MPGVMVLKPAIGNVAPDSYAESAGLQFGDKIVAVDGKTVGDWESALVAILDSMVATGRVPLSLEDERGGQRRAVLEVGGDASRLTEPGMLFEGLGFDVWQPPAVIGSLTAGLPAEGAGLSVGDRITAIDGETVTSWTDLLAIVKARPGKSVNVDYMRGGYAGSVELTLGEEGEGEERRGLIGIGIANTWEDYYALRKYSPLESFSAAVEKTWTSTLFTVRMLGRMVTGDVSMKNISGPINIAQFAGESAERGLTYFLGFLAIISISLGVLNLLPIPVLDGGQIVYQLVELAKGSPLTERAQILGQQIGILALLLLMSFAFYNDIARILG
jgi:regulator of sigma E protease